MGRVLIISGLEEDSIKAFKYILHKHFLDTQDLWLRMLTPRAVVVDLYLAFIWEGCTRENQICMFVLFIDIEGYTEYTKSL